MKSWLFAGVALLGSAIMAQAAVITEDYQFSLGGFTDAIGTSSAPISSITGSFTLQFDPTMQQSNSTTGLSNVVVIGFQSASPYSFSYNPNNKFLSFGGSQNGPNTVALETSDLAVQIDIPTPNSPSLFSCASGFSCGRLTGDATYTASAYTLSSSSTAYFATEAMSSVSAISSSVPEPSTWAMMLLGFGGLGCLLYRKARKDDVLPMMFA